MAKGPRKSALTELVRSGLVGDGELLRYKSKKGALLAIGRAREGGIEVEGKSKLLGYTAFEDVSGSGYHRPAEHTHTSSGRNLQGLQLLAAGADDVGAGGRGGRGEAAAAPAPPPVELLEDESDDLCHVCGLGGDLVCCETCPAVFHAACLGLSAPPEGDYHCPHCRCTVCGAGGAEGMVPTGCQWVDCSHFVAPDTLQQHSRPHIGAVGSATAEPADQSGAAAAAAAGGSEPMQVDGAEPAAGATGSEAAAAPADGTADFSRMDAAATAAWQLSSAPAEAAAAVMQAAAAEAPATAAVYCPVTCGWTHLHCFPAEFQQSVQEATPICISSQAASDVSTRLAAVCSAGLLPLGSVPEGARAGSSTAGGEGASSSATTIPLSLLVVRGAAVASPADCRAHAPAYSPEQRLQLRAALSAALHVLHSCFEPLPDSRTGADMLPWLLRGAVLVPGEADYSAFNTAVLYAGPVVVGVAVFRCFGELAELPLLAVRPELQKHNGLGRLLLAAVERLLLAAGAKALFVPAFTAEGVPYLPLASPAEGGAAPAPPTLLQSKWGFQLAPAQQVLAACVYPLLRLPGVLLAWKQLEAGSVLPPPRLPQRLQWSGAVEDARQLLRDGLVAAVASTAAPQLAGPAAAAAARAAAAAAAGPSSKPPLAKKPGRPKKPAGTAAVAGVADVKTEEPQQLQTGAAAAGTPEEQQAAALQLYQQRLAQRQQQQVLAAQHAYLQQFSPEMAAAYLAMLMRAQQNPQAYALQQQQTAALLMQQQQQAAAQQQAQQYQAAVAALQQQQQAQHYQAALAAQQQQAAAPGAPLQQHYQAALAQQQPQAVQQQQHQASLYAQQQAAAQQAQQDGQADSGQSQV